MDSSEALIDRLVSTAQQLTPEKKEQLLDFAEYLLEKDKGNHAKLTTSTKHEILDPTQNPLRKLAGLVSISNLGVDTDNVVYDM